MSSPVDWKNEQAHTYVLSLNVPSDSLVCRSYRDDVTRVLPNPCYVPRRRKGKGSIASKSRNCCVVNCNNTMFAASAVATSDELQHAFDSTGLKRGSEVIPGPCIFRPFQFS